MDARVKPGHDGLCVANSDGRPDTPSQSRGLTANSRTYAALGTREASRIIGSDDAATTSIA
jgi:hypothetical protein